MCTLLVVSLLLFQASLAQTFSLSVASPNTPSGMCAMRMKGGDDGTTLVLNDGTKHPMIGFGTYKVGFIPASASSAAANPSTAATAGPSARECVR
jgi:hypothetical protein